MLRIGLTGGICAGKTTVSDAFEALGVPVVDADRISRQLVEPGQPALQEIVNLFGEGILHEDGTLNRKALRELIFADHKQRRRLEQILHPAIRAATQTALSEFEREGHAYAINVVPLLVETGSTDSFDRILLVDVPEAVQLERLMKRDGADARQAREILAAQASRADRRAAADDVLLNTATADELKVQVKELHQRYVALAGKTVRDL